ncbi:phospholipase C/P1 nuclease [Punctularia strigosozonata HHB-11173 SS5]|uniref:phospholipase C/P1 nuclease n=1 Tax=Punctularia strigosozonata (strain HHB-11173) TaxID=741275 RepID=UPI0004417F18|nr:phospholipase C/P1 nuclease [Punctularia strigosozonata HHB-11173 SS5]EIN09062.1 phospholipase C/P1 nuclease [Punctularia strigosozonata HHB-11173 SS5]
MHLHPSVMPTLCSILYPEGPWIDCHLARVATWADSVRTDPAYAWSKNRHFANSVDDDPPNKCIFPGRQGWNGKEGENILASIRNVTDILTKYADREVEFGARAGRSSSRSVAQKRMSGKRDALAEEALKFLIHFFGDMHQPLHLSGRQYGGNGAKVLFDGRLTNLHYAWDNLFIAKQLRTTSPNYTFPLPSRYYQVENALKGAIYDPYIRRIVYEGLVKQEMWDDDVEDWISCPKYSHTAGGGTAQKTSSTFSASTASEIRQIFFGQTPNIATRPTRSTATESKMDDEIVCPLHWAGSIHRLNCDFVWPAALDKSPPSPSATADAPSPAIATVDDQLALFSESGLYIGGSHVHGNIAGGYNHMELDTPEYAGVIARNHTVEGLLTRGGIRLASVLNWLFADIGDVKREDRVAFVYSTYL